MREKQRNHGKSTEKKPGETDSEGGETDRGELQKWNEIIEKPEIAVF